MLRRVDLLFPLLIAAALLLMSNQPPRANADASDGPSSATAEPKVRQNVSSLVEGSNEFAIELYQRLRTGESNLFFSPISISTALAMTYAGAAGGTASEMAKTLHFEM